MTQSMRQKEQYGWREISRRKGDSGLGYMSQWEPDTQVRAKH